MREYAIVPLLNGFDPNNEDKVDEFSRAVLEKSVAVYRRMKEKGFDGHFLVIRSIVRSRVKKNIWFEVMRKEAIGLGVDPSDIVLTDIETTGALTDGLAISRFSKKNSELAIYIIAANSSVAGYFRATYKAVGRILDNNPDFDFGIWYLNEGPVASLKTRILYFGLWLFTVLISTGYTDFLFRLWFKFRDWHDRKRISGFVRTVE